GYLAGATAVTRHPAVGGGPHRTPTTVGADQRYARVPARGGHQQRGTADDPVVLLSHRLVQAAVTHRTGQAQPYRSRPHGTVLRQPPGRVATGTRGAVPPRFSPLGNGLHEHGAPFS